MSQLSLAKGLEASEVRDALYLAHPLTPTHTHSRHMGWDLSTQGYPCGWVRMMRTSTCLLVQCGCGLAMLRKRSKTLRVLCRAGGTSHEKKQAQKRDEQRRVLMGVGGFQIERMRCREPLVETWKHMACAYDSRAPRPTLATSGVESKGWKLDQTREDRVWQSSPLPSSGRERHTTNQDTTAFPNLIYLESSMR